MIVAGRASELVARAKQITVLSIDLPGVEGANERMSAQQHWDFLRASTSEMDHAIQRHGGILDTWFGSAVMAFWNAPNNTPDHQTCACLAALDIAVAFERLTGRTAAEGGPTVTAGINSGEAVVGIMEYGRRRRFTVHGDEVSLTHLIQGANKFFGTRLLVSEAVFKHAKAKVGGRSIGRVRMVGREQAVDLYELIDRNERLSPAWQQAIPIFSEGVSQYAGRAFKDAADSFKRVLDLFPNDAPSRLYLTLSEELSLSNPPDGWEGTFNLTSR